MTTDTRSRLLAELATGREHTGNLARRLGIPPSTARYWLDKLETEGLITSTGGRWHIYWSLKRAASRPSIPASEYDALCDLFCAVCEAHRIDEGTLRDDLRATLDDHAIEWAVEILNGARAQELFA